MKSRNVGIAKRRYQIERGRPRRRLMGEWGVVGRGGQILAYYKQ